MDKHAAQSRAWYVLSLIGHGVDSRLTIFFHLQGSTGDEGGCREEQGEVAEVVAGDNE